FDWGTGFGSLIPAAKRGQVVGLMRAKEALGFPRNISGDAMYGANGWDADYLRRAYDRVTQQQAGICISFALACAHILTDGQVDGPRVEVVAFQNHAYVLVNRVGGVSGAGRIPADWVGQPE